MFVNRTDAYATQEILGGVCSYFTKYQPVTRDLFDAHLAGRITLGLPALDQNGLSRWCCFDSDKEDGALDRIERWLSEHGWQCHRESKRQGRAGHLWLFLKEPIPAADLRLFANRVATLANAAGKVEIFPKQDHSTWDAGNARFKASSLVRLPLGINRKPDAHGARGWFAGAEQGILSQVFWLESLELNPVKPILDAAPGLRLIEQTKHLKSNRTGRFGPPTAEETERILGALDCINPNQYRIWCQVGMALKAGGFDLSLWETWSSKSSKYTPGQCARKWTTFHGNKTGLGTIFYLAANPHM
jgi:hypothetical protein